MRRILLAAAGFAALAGVAGFALAQEPGAAARQHGVFQSDANSDGILTRQEFDAGRTATFTRLDTNNDGQLTREERRAERGEHHGRRGGGRHGGGMHGFEGADANSDGNITRDEFLARPTQMFDRLDANHDGVITTAERPQRPQRAAGERRERPERVNPDTNGDNQLSRAEFAAAGSGMFERLDANSDGRVTREEADAARPHRRGH
jgi:Ca2+-binding EF-hand superfamily protein